MNLAIRDIRANKLRFSMTTVGVALLLAAAAGMGGLYRGVVADALRQINLMQTDLWVVEGGTAGPFAEPSRVSFDVQSRVAGVAGAANVRTYFEATATVNGVSRSVIGLDWPTDRGEWLELTRGRHLASGRGEAIVDADMGFEVGDDIYLGRERFRVVGTAHRFLSSMGEGMVAIGLQDARDLQAERPVAEARMASLATSGFGATPAPVSPSEQRNAMATAVLVDVAPGTNPDDLAATIERWGDVSVVRHSAQEAYLLEGRLGRLRGQILAFTVLLFAITAVVVTLIVYTLTIEKLHEIAMLKLLGARDRMILSMIVQQSMAIGVMAWITAQLLGGLIFPLFPRDVVLLPMDRVVYGVVLLVICFLASGLGVSKALRVEAQEILA